MGMKQKKLQRITSELQARAYLHPRRIEILKLLQSPATLSQVAAQLEVHPANLSHHFKKLQKARLIALVEERDLGRVVEKYFQAVALRFEMPAGNIESGAARALLTLQQALSEAISGMESDEQRAIALLRRARLREEEVEHFFSRLQLLVQDLENASARAEMPGADKKVPADGRRTFEINASIYPVNR
ncbi:MAG: helix-turn-helix domain-containing protein [Leptospiraceae bacterium]|nr:helix-turn-helix domain-containing protein [Leptospiraceae bacterium]